MGLLSHFSPSLKFVIDILRLQNKKKTKKRHASNNYLTIRKWNSVNRSVLLAVALVCLTSDAISQKLLSKIEIRPYLKEDWYPEFSYHYMGRVSTDYLKMEGTSWGVDLNYQVATTRKINYRIGLGYLRYRFNRLKNFNSDFGGSDSRIINYPSQLDPIFVTNKYLYNIIPLSIGIQKLFVLASQTKIFSGAEIDNFFTVSQSYKIKYRSATYRVNDKSLFGNSFQLSCGIIKQYQNLNIGPVLSIPVYTVWHKDDVFAEKEKEKRSKWLNGFSIGIQIQLSVNKN